MLDLPTIAQARASRNHMGLTEAFLDSLSSNSLGGESEPVIPLTGTGSSKFVRVYRVITFHQALEQLDINHNYKDGNALYDWKGDFVTPNLDWVWVYAGGYGKDILAEYLIPAKFLEIDLTTRKQEPYYVISKRKLQRAGLRNVSVFLARLARVERFKVEDPNWEPDPRFDDRSPQLIGSPPDSIKDKRIKWVDSRTLEMIIQRGED